MLHAYQMRQRHHSRYSLLFSNSDDKWFEPLSSGAETMKTVRGKKKKPLKSPFKDKHRYEGTLWLLIISHTDIAVEGLWRRCILTLWDIGFSC